VVFRAIGHGAFGKVCEGLYNMPGETTTSSPVAVKVLYHYQLLFASFIQHLNIIIDVMTIVHGTGCTALSIFYSVSALYINSLID